MSKIPVSVCIIAKNEEKYIEGCLKHLKPFGFEIVVTDTGSTDRTKEIAEKYADKVLDFEWIDDFSAARNFCAEHASNRWILSLDCDEYVSSVDVNGLRMAMQKFPKCVGILHLKNLLIDNHGNQRYTVDDVTRFYNKGRYTYVNAIHEQLVLIKGEDVDKYPSFHMPMEVIHHGYNITGEEMERKQKRNLRLLEKSLESNPDDAYIWFQIGQSSFILNDFDRAIEAYNKGLSLESDMRKAFVEVMVTSLGKAYMSVEKDKEALEVLKKYEGDFKSAKYTYLLADAYMLNEQPLKALLNYIKTISMKDVNTLGDSLPTCYQNIIMIYREMGRPDMADMFVKKYEESQKEMERVINA